MSKESRTIGVNTDPLSVQLYFDENNAIKWKIIFKTTTETNSYVPPMSLGINHNPHPQQNDIQEQKVEHMITTIFKNIYIINPKNDYLFDYKNKQLIMNESYDQKLDDIEYSSFDHIKYNKLTKESLDKNIAWRHYLKNMKNKNEIRLDLNTIEMSHIDAMIDIITEAIANSYNEILVIIDDFTLNNTNLIWLQKNKEKYEIAKSKILLLGFTGSASTDPTKKIDSIPTIKSISIKSFVIRSSLYDGFLKKLNTRKITWESCLCQIIEENQFDSYQINNELFI